MKNCCICHIRSRVRGQVLCSECLRTSSASRALGLASAAAATPAQRTKRASKAGKASAARLTPAQRTERARKAGRARWAKASDVHVDVSVTGSSSAAQLGPSPTGFRIYPGRA
jgi:hypothetical protein